MRASAGRIAIAGVMLSALLVGPGCIMLRSDEIPEWVPKAARPATPTPAVSKSPQPVKGGLVAYFVKGGKLVSAPREGKVSATSAKQALEAVLAGPSAAERAAGMTSAIPDGTRVNDAAQDFNGYMLVDLSPEFASGASGASVKLRVAQVVYTLSQLPNTKGVLIQIGGKPVERFGKEGYRLMRPLTRGDIADVAPGG